MLNLAGNQIVLVDSLSGLDALAELNLRRNKIRAVVCTSDFTCHCQCTFNVLSHQHFICSYRIVVQFEDGELDFVFKFLITLHLHYVIVKEVVVQGIGAFFAIIKILVKQGEMYGYYF